MSVTSRGYRTLQQHRKPQEAFSGVRPIAKGFEQNLYQDPTTGEIFFAQSVRSDENCASKMANKAPVEKCPKTGKQLQ
jgi:hypothetical protein